MFSLNVSQSHLLAYQIWRGARGATRPPLGYVTRDFQLVDWTCIRCAVNNLERDCTIPVPFSLYIIVFDLAAVSGLTP